MTDMNTNDTATAAKIAAELNFANIHYHNALDDGIGINSAKECLRNIAFSYVEDIISLLGKMEKLQSDNDAYAIALEDADKEIQQLKAGKQKKD